MMYRKRMWFCMFMLLLSTVCSAVSTVSVAGFRLYGVPENTGQLLENTLTQKISAQAEYILVERQQLDQMIQEKGLDLSGLTEGQRAEALHDAVRVDKLVMGNISLWDERYYVFARLIDVKSGRIDAVASYETEALNYNFIGDVLVKDLLGAKEEPAADETFLNRIYRNILNLSAEDVARLKERYDTDILNALYGFFNDIDQNPARLNEQDKELYLLNKMGKKMDLEPEEILLLELTSKLRLLGQLVIPQHVLQERIPLTETEYDLVKYYPMASYNILDQQVVRDNISLSPQLYNKLIRMILFHRKKMDGSGIPRDMVLEKYYRENEIVAICNVYITLIHERGYREPPKKFDTKKAVELLKNGIGMQWSQQVYDMFISILSKY